ncbi:hypothetical protein [Streptomyces turgidiscabies]|uniref:hypothetical protein n=1 Tax=Streptomyces turgidiscabies TaxID=85558 RepID=UPI0038F7C2E5
MSERPAALDGLLGYVAANLPNEEAATAKARAAIAPLEKAVLAAKTQERAELREATLVIAAHHLRTTLYTAVYEDAGQRAAEGVTRAADELLHLVADPHTPIVAPPRETEPTLAVSDLLRRTESYLSALHGSVARHDNLGENLGCAGCQLRDQFRAELRSLTRPAADPS